MTTLTTWTSSRFCETKSTPGQRTGEHLDEDVNEDVLYFEDLIAKNPSLLRKVTNRKAKKLDSLSAAVDGDDFTYRRVLSGKSPVPHRPPFGKVWLKQRIRRSDGLEHDGRHDGHGHWRSS